MTKELNLYSVLVSVPGEHMISIAAKTPEEAREIVENCFRNREIMGSKVIQVVDNTNINGVDIPVEALEQGIREAIQQQEFEAEDFKANKRKVN